jgi:cyanate lyase
MKARAAIVEKILTAKLEQGLKWQAITTALGLPLTKGTAACLGQMPLTEVNVNKLDEFLGLNLSAIEKATLQEAPDRGSLEALIPADPTVYRFYEFLLIYGSTLKQLISDQFGDGVMSTTDFDLVVDAKGDRVHVEMSGKFMPFTMK